MPIIAKCLTKTKKIKPAVGGLKKEVYSKVVCKITDEKFSNPGICELAIIANTASISELATIAPFVYCGENVVIGERARIYPNSIILDDTIISNDVIIKSGSVIGGEGFG